MILIRAAGISVAGGVSRGVGHQRQGVATRPGHHPALASIAIALVVMLSVREVRPHAQPKQPPRAEFGVSVAAGPGFLFVAANPQKDEKDGGSVHVFQRSGSTWMEARVLSTPEATVQDIFGVPMATDGHTLVVGAQFADEHGTDSGIAYVFERRDGSWPRVAVLSASDAAAGAQFGLTVSISGDTIVVGARLASVRGKDAGAAYVFERRAGSWAQAAKLTASDAAAGDLFGRASVEDGAMIVSADLNDDRGDNAGKAYAFEKRGDTWTEVEKMFAGDAAARSEFGIALVLQRGVAVLGAVGAGASTAGSGAAYAFERRDGRWMQTAKVQPADADRDQWFGFSVAKSDETIVVGAPAHSGDVRLAGAAYVFERQAGAWTQTARLIASDRTPGMGFGHSVAISGDTILVGVTFNGDGAHPGSGYVFERSGGSWSEVARLRPRQARR